MSGERRRSRRRTLPFLRGAVLEFGQESHIVVLADLSVDAWSPWYVWATGDGGAKRFLLLEAWRGRREWSLRVWVFDAEGHLKSETSWSAGHVSLVDASLTKNESGVPVVTITCEGRFDSLRYALVRERLEPVR